MKRSTPPSWDVSSATRAKRQTSLELARIYVASSAYSAAIETLSSFPDNGWDEEIHLLRAEALVGLGRVEEAFRIVGQPVLPEAESVRSFDSWRFLLQLRILHRRGEYRRVVEIGRAYFDAGDGVPSVYLARTAMVVAQSMLAQKCPADARRFYEHVLELYDRLGSKEGQVDSLLGIANTHLLDCQWDKADALYQEARFRYEELGLTDKALAACINLGVVRVKRGEFRSGRELLEDALVRAAQLGSVRRMVTIHLAIAMAEIRSGNPEAARSHLAEVIVNARRMGAERDMGLALEFLGELYLSEGRWARAETILQRALAIGLRIAPEGDIVFEVLRRLAEVSLGLGDLNQASARAERAKVLAEGFGDSYEVATCHRVLAEIAYRRGEREEAESRIESAKTMLDRLGETYERGRIIALRRRWNGLVVYRSSSAGSVPRATQGAGSGKRRGATVRATARSPQAAPRSRTNGMTGSTAGNLSGTAFRARSSSGRNHDLELGLRSTTPEMVRALQLAKSVSELDIPLLLRGSPGTGLESLSRQIHYWSRRSGPYVPFHCANVDREALERELRGKNGRSGLRQIAEGGTLFLDSITSLRLECQHRLAEWIAEVTDPASPSTIRVIAAARSRPGEAHPTPVCPSLHRHLDRVVIELPPLRERYEDIPRLVRDLVLGWEQRFGKCVRVLPADVLRDWSHREWPGNLDELRDVVERYARENPAIDGIERYVRGNPAIDG
ncbi:MAG: sigma 54-interacting transcriptional regulator [Candidatus Eisenbacteria bacterium]|nr:sigma 54-interacting transcriptional regulator [Candidatus Eisenbacteria bacterium]